MLHTTSGLNNAEVAIGLLGCCSGHSRGDRCQVHSVRLGCAVSPLRPLVPLRGTAAEGGLSCFPTFVPFGAGLGWGRGGTRIWTSLPVRGSSTTTSWLLRSRC